MPTSNRGWRALTNLLAIRSIAPDLKQSEQMLNMPPIIVSLASVHFIQVDSNRFQKREAARSGCLKQRRSTLILGSTFRSGFDGGIRR